MNSSGVSLVETEGAVLSLGVIEVTGVSLIDRLVVPNGAVVLLAVNSVVRMVEDVVGSLMELSDSLI